MLRKWGPSARFRAPAPLSRTAEVRNVSAPMGNAGYLRRGPDPRSGKLHAVRQVLNEGPDLEANWGLHWPLLGYRSLVVPGSGLGMHWKQSSQVGLQRCTWREPWPHHVFRTARGSRQLWDFMGLGCPLCRRPGFDRDTPCINVPTTAWVGKLSLLGSSSSARGRAGVNVSSAHGRILITPWMPHPHAHRGL